MGTYKIEIKTNKKKLKVLDAEIAAHFSQLEEIMEKNLKKATELGEKHVLGTYKEFIEARVKSLELHIKNLRAKRKYEESKRKTQIE